MAAKKTDVETETDAKIAALTAEVERLKTNPQNFQTRAICNVCGDDVDEKCPKHPNDKTNHIRTTTDTEKAEKKGDFALVKQT